MKIQIKPSLLVPESQQSFDLQLVQTLLHEIAEGKTLTSAAKNAGINYRNLISLFNSVEIIFREKLIDRVKGHGTALTDFGNSFLSYLDEKSFELESIATSFQDGLNQRIKKYSEAIEPKLIFYTSSDPIIQNCAFGLASVELKVAGSGESLERLIAGDASIAGYNVSSESDSKVIYRRLSKLGMDVFPVMKRTQGLITKKGNPLGIKSVHDLLNPKLRFINRQIGSGTRLLLDRVLLQEGIDPAAINGYESEEYTHSAIASAILANKADVGLGVKNIAVNDGLGFIPIMDEIFFLAMKQDISRQPVISKLIRKVRKLSSETPGYKSIGLNRQIEGWI
jgi:molybdate transport repressor ModE-like protein